MSEHPDTQYLLGNGSYHNIPTLRPISTEKEFRLDPKPLSLASLSLMNLLFAAVFAVLFALAYSRNPEPACFVILAVGLVTSLSYSTIVTTMHRNSQRKGPAFIFCRNTGSFQLPRHNESFASGNHCWFECLTARTQNDQHGEACSEFNLVCQQDGKTRRWNIMRSIATVDPFDGLDKRIQHETGIVVRRIVS